MCSCIGLAIAVFPPLLAVMMSTTLAGAGMFNIYSLGWLEGEAKGFDEGYALGRRKARQGRCHD